MAGRRAHGRAATWRRLAVGGSATVVAGDTTEYCYADVPGSTIDFGFAVQNTGSHPVTLTSVGPAFSFAGQTVTVDASVDIARGVAGRDVAPDHLPITIQPGVTRMLYLAIHIPASATMSPGQAFTDRVTLHIRTLGMTRTEDFPFGFDTSPVWIGISGSDAHTRPCDFNTPDTPAQ